MKAKRFFYHFFRYGEKKMSVHFEGKCLNVDHVVCTVPCETKFNKRQPLLVMQGFCTDVTVEGDTAFIS